MFVMLEFSLSLSAKVTEWICCLCNRDRNPFLMRDPGQLFVFGVILEASLPLKSDKRGSVSHILTPAPRSCGR